MHCVLPEKYCSLASAVIHCVETQCDCGEYYFGREEESSQEWGGFHGYAQAQKI